MKKLNILLIEDVEADYLLIARHIRKSNLNAELSWVRNMEEMAAAIDMGGWDLVLSDYKVPGLDFLETLDLLQKRLVNVPVILVSGSVGEERAVELLKNGLADFILKDRLFRLIPAIERSLAEEAERRRRREAEAKLIQNEGLMRSVLEGTSDAIFVKDREGRYLFFNQAAARFTGSSAALVIGRDDTFIFPPETARKIREYDLGILATGTVETHEEELEHFNGARRFHLVTKGPVFDSRGQVSGLFGISRDISENKMAERVRQLNLRLLQLIYNQFDIAALLPVFVKEIRHIIGCDTVIISMLDENGSLLHQASEASEPACSGIKLSFPYHPECIMCNKVIRAISMPPSPTTRPAVLFT
jgi:PAS domain S-box-containing protein